MPDVRERLAATGLDPITPTGTPLRDDLRGQWEGTGRVIRGKQIALND